MRTKAPALLVSFRENQGDGPGRCTNGQHATVGLGSVWRVVASIANLSTVAPDEFVAARAALVKVLRHDKRRDEAAEVAALRRPGSVDWALNCVATQSEELIEKVSAGVNALRDAQAAAFDEGGRSDRLREAVGESRSVAAELRQAAEGVLRHAQRPRSDMAALAIRVNEVIANTNLLELLRIGHLGMRSVEVADPFAGMPEPNTRADVQAAAKQRGPAKLKLAPVVDAEVELRKARAIKLEQARVAATQALASARSELEDAQGAHDRAVEALRMAEVNAKRTEKRLAAAQTRVKDAERSLRDALAES